MAAPGETKKYEFRVRDFSLSVTKITNLSLQVSLSEEKIYFPRLDDSPAKEGRLVFAAFLLEHYNSTVALIPVV